MESLLSATTTKLTDSLPEQQAADPWHIRQLMLHMMIEQHYTLLADVTEEEMSLPDEAEWLQKAERSADEELPALLEEIEQKQLEHRLLWQPVGGQFEEVEIATDDNDTAVLTHTALPELLYFKRYAKRILVKLSPMTCKIALFIDHNADKLPTKQEFIQQAILLRDNLVADSDTKPSGPMKFSVQFEVYILGQDDNRMLQDAKNLTIKFNARNQVFITCLCINSDQQTASSPSPLKTYSRLRQVRNILRQPELTAEQIRLAFAKNNFSWRRIITAACLSFLALIIWRWLLISNEFDDFVFLTDVLSPFIIIAGFSGSMKNKSRLFDQTLYSYVGFALLFCSFIFGLGWPADIGTIIYVLKTVLVGGGLLLFWVRMVIAYD